MLSVSLRRSDLLASFAFANAVMQFTCSRNRCRVQNLGFLVGRGKKHMQRLKNGNEVRQSKNERNREIISSCINFFMVYIGLKSGI